MQLYCVNCNRPFKNKEEVTFIGHAFFRLLGSKVTYSISTPHEVEKESFVHRNEEDCKL